MSKDKKGKELSPVSKKNHELNLAINTIVQTGNNSPKSAEYTTAVNRIFQVLSWMRNSYDRLNPVDEGDARRLNIILDNASLEEWEALFKAAALDPSPLPMKHLLFTLKNDLNNSFMQINILEENFDLLLNYVEKHYLEVGTSFISVFDAAYSASVNSLSLTNTEIIRLINIVKSQLSNINADDGEVHVRKETAKKLLIMLMAFIKINPVPDEYLNAVIGMAENNGLVMNLFSCIEDLATVYPLSDRTIQVMIRISKEKNLETKLFHLLNHLVIQQPLSVDNQRSLIALVRTSTHLMPAFLQLLKKTQINDRLTFMAEIKASPVLLTYLLNDMESDYKQHRKTILDTLSDQDLKDIIAAATKNTDSAKALLKLADALNSEHKILQIADKREISELMSIAADEYPKGIAVLLDVVEPSQALGLLVLPINPALVSNNENVMFYSLMNNPKALPALLSKVLSSDQDDARAISTCALVLRNIYENRETNSQINVYNQKLHEILPKEPAAERAFWLMSLGFSLNQFKRQAMVDKAHSEIFNIASTQGEKLFGVLRKAFEKAAANAGTLTQQDKKEMRQRCMEAINNNKQTLLHTAKNITGLETMLESRFTKLTEFVTTMTADTPKPSQSGMFRAKPAPKRAPPQAGLDEDDSYRL